MAHDHGNQPHRAEGANPRGAEGAHPHSADEWNDKYSSAERLWTSDANPALIREVVDLTPGRALDVGTGEGADSRWLADQGWTVVAVDISQVAIDRAAEIDSREAITWQQTDLTVDDVEPAAFDVSFSAGAFLASLIMLLAYNVPTLVFSLMLVFQRHRLSRMRQLNAMRVQDL